MLGRITAGLFFLLLIWGNLVTGMHAGMACPDWPLCKGSLIPPFRLDVWMEYLHLVLAAVATVFLLLFARQRLVSYQYGVKTVPLAALLFLAVEIALGAIMVNQGLPAEQTTIHFMIGLAVFVLVLYMAMCDGEGSPVRFSISGFAGPMLYIAFLFYFQASLGAFLRNSGFGLACPDFPTCRGLIIPTVLDGPTVVQFSHRLLALGPFGTILLLFLVSLIDKRLKERQTDLLALVSLVALQIVVGAATVKSGLSYPVTALHLALTLVLIAFALRTWLRYVAEAEVPRR